MDREKAKKWVKEHRTELAVGGGILGVSVAALLICKKVTSTNIGQGLKNAGGIPREPIISNDTITKVTREVSSCKVTAIEKPPHAVSEHIRNLPLGWEASPEKIASAAEHGYELLPGQTWVEAYFTGRAAGGG